MKRAFLTLLFLVALLLSASPAQAQFGNTTTIRFTGAPTGACAPFSFGINSATGDLYDCVAATWTIVGTGGGGGAPGGATGNIQFKSGASTFGGITGSSVSGSTQVTWTAQGAAQTPLAFVAAMAQSSPLLSLSNAGATALGLLSVHGDGVGNADNLGTPTLIDLNVTDSGTAMIAFHNASNAGGASAYWLLGVGDTGNLGFYGTNDNMSYTGFSMNPTTNHVILDGGGVGGSYLTALRYDTLTNCNDSVGDAACGSAPEGAVVVDAADTTTVVSTTAVTANSTILVQYAPYLSTRLSVICNATASIPSVTAISAGASFTITVAAAPVTNPACFVYRVTN